MTADLPWETVGPKWQSKRQIFNAKFPGRCGGGDRIKANQFVCYHKGKLWHEGCAETDDPSDPNPPQIRRCERHGVPLITYLDGTLRCVCCRPAEALGAMEYAHLSR